MLAVPNAIITLCAPPGIAYTTNTQLNPYWNITKTNRGKMQQNTMKQEIFKKIM